MAETYELMPTEPPPDLPGRVTVRGDRFDVAEALARDLSVHAQNCVRAFGDCHIALPGGDAAAPLYRCLATDPSFRSFPWSRTRIWVITEAIDDGLASPGSARALHELFVTHCGVPPENVHAASGPAEDARAQLDASLREALAWREPGQDRLDFVLLSLNEPPPWAGPWRAREAPHAPLYEITGSDADRRISLSSHAVGAARLIAVFGYAPAVGGSVQLAVSKPADHPFASIRPLGGDLAWYLDRDACGFDEATDA